MLAFLCTLWCVCDARAFVTMYPPYMSACEWIHIMHPTPPTRRKTSLGDDHIRRSVARRNLSFIPNYSFSEVKRNRGRAATWEEKIYALWLQRSTRALMALNGLRGGRKMGVWGGEGGRGDLHWSGGTSTPTPAHMRAHKRKTRTRKWDKGAASFRASVAADWRALLRADEAGLGIGGSCWHRVRIQTFHSHPIKCPDARLVPRREMLRRALMKGDTMQRWQSAVKPTPGLIHLCVCRVWRWTGGRCHGDKMPITSGGGGGLFCKRRLPSFHFSSSVLCSSLCFHPPLYSRHSTCMLMGV